MKDLLFVFIAFMCPLSVFSQNVEVEGGIKADSLDVQTGLIKNVADPVFAQDAATKGYVGAIEASFYEELLDAGLNGFVEDIDENKYKTIKIGTQVWMAENLKTTKYNDGTSIALVTENQTWQDLTTPALCWYDNESSSAEQYGALYNYYTVADTNSLNVCPTGWHVPTDAEWTIFSDFLAANGYGYGMSEDSIAKSVASTFGWHTGSDEWDVGSDQGVNNSSGFSGRPAGFRSNLGAFDLLAFGGFWWSSTEFSTTDAVLRYLLYDQGYLGPIAGTPPASLNKHGGISVRCLRD